MVKSSYTGKRTGTDMVNLQKRDSIYQLSTNYNHFIGIYYFTNIVIVFTVILNLYIMYSLKHITEDSSILTSTLPYYLIWFSAYSGVIIPPHADLPGIKYKTTIPKMYDLYSLLPLTKENILNEETKFLTTSVILSAIYIIGLNCVYLINPVLKDVAGLFVITTLLMVIFMSITYLSKYYTFKHSGALIISGVVIYMIIVVINSILLMIDKTIYVIHFLGLDFFKTFAGIPMLVISVLYVPILYCIHMKLPVNKRKLAAWYH